MSKYKVGFMVDSCAGIQCDNREVIDLVDDWDYSEEEAKEIVNDEVKLRKVFNEWLWETIEFGYQHLKTAEEVKQFKRGSWG